MSENMSNVNTIEIKASDYPNNVIKNLLDSTYSNFVDYGVSFVNAGDTNKSIPSDIKTKLIVENGKIKIEIYDKGNYVRTQYLMPEVEYFKVLNNRVVMVYFCDGSTEKAVLDKNDIFNIELAVTICIMKKLLSVTCNGNGSSVYNKLVEHFRKAFIRQVDSEERAKNETKVAREREKKRIAKVKAKREKRENAMREEMIEIQKEAYIRAMRELNNGTPANE